MPDGTIEDRSARSIRFRESMPRPLMLVFLVFAAVGVGLVFWLMFRPPSPGLLALELRRSPPVGSFTHDVVDIDLIAIPTPLPVFAPKCPVVEGVVIEGGPPALERVGGELNRMCSLDGVGVPAEAQQAFRALSKARIRFAKFTRTGDQSTLDLSTGRILLSVALSRTNVQPEVIAPLLIHEGWHLATGGPVTAAQEFKARLAELQACGLFVERFTRGCLDAQAIVRLGESRAIELLVRAGFPR